MNSGIQLLLIDPQNDFCDLPESWWGREAGSDHSPRSIRPALPVPGAHLDLLRLAGALQQWGSAIDGITITLDSHHAYDIAHPGFWRDADGQCPAPFTQVTLSMFHSGQLRPASPLATNRVEAYLQELDRQGRYTLMIWPVHCEVGSWGHNLHAAVRSACAQWELSQQQVVHTIRKGLNPWTEHYSALKAEVPDPSDPETMLNLSLVERLDQARHLLVAGQASSHCVRSTVEDLAANLPSGDLQKLILLSDAMSPVAGFESADAEFLASLQQQGARVWTVQQASQWISTRTA